MTATEQDFPYRHATRLVNAFQFRVGTANLRALDHDFAAAMLFLMIYRQALRMPDERRISVNGIATSLGQSTETMRRAAQTLVACGGCRSTGRGIERTPGLCDLPWVEQLATEIDASLVELLDDYRRCGFPLLGAPGGQLRNTRLEAALDIQLSALELGETRNRKAASLYIVGTVAVLNAAGLKNDTEAGLRYGYDNTVPPDALRNPVSASQVVEATGLAKTTVWRHLTAAEKNGALRRTVGGYLLGERYMHDPVTSRRSREKINYVHRVLEDLGSGRYVRERYLP